MTLGLVDHWCEIWRSSATPPDLPAFLAEHPEVSADELGELLLVEQQYQWRSGPGPRVEEYLARFPQIGVDPESLLDLVYGELRARRNLGFPSDLDRFTARFPAVADQLRKQLELVCWFDEEPPSQDTTLLENSLDNLVDVSDQRPQRFGEYDVVELIARTGMSVVFKARHRELGRIVALKMISPDLRASRGEVQRFKNEVHVIAQLDHRNLLPMLEVGEQDGTLYFTSRLIERGTLADNVDHFRGRPNAIAKLVQKVASAIHHAHQRGVLHRDLKPTNVLLENDDQPLVADFGLARRMEEFSDLTNVDDLLGSPVWLAPELAVEKPKPATIACDIYGVGTLLYFLLTGRPPFRGESLLDTLTQVREHDPHPPRQIDSSINRDLEMICLKAMDKDPSRRYATADMLSQDLEAFLNGLPTTARALPWWEQQRRWTIRHPLTATVGGMLLLGVLLGTITAATYVAHERRLSGELASLIDDVRVSQDAANQTRQEQRQLLYAAHVRQSFAALQDGDVRQGQTPSLDSSAHPPRSAFGYRERMPSLGNRPAGDAILTETADQLAVLAAEQCSSASFSPDGAFVAITVLNHVHVWSCQTWEVVDRLIGHRDATTAVAYSPDGRWIASASRDRSIRIWDSSNGQEHVRMLGHRDWVERLAFSPDGKSLVSTSRDGTVKVWHVASGELLCELCESHADPPIDIAFSPDGEQLAIRMEQGQIVLINTSHAEL